MFSTYFDLSKDGFPWFAVVMSVICVVMAIGIYTANRKKETNQLAAGFLILLPLIILGISFQDYMHYVDILHKGTYFTIEGIPQDCDTSGFRIEYVPFTFNGRISTSSYNGSRDGVKVLCSGASVRVAFTDMLMQDERNTILRIEVQQ